MNFNKIVHLIIFSILFTSFADNSINKQSNQTEEMVLLDTTLMHNKVYGVKKVDRIEYVNQGLIIITNQDSSILTINGEKISFDKKLYLKTETGSYKFSVISPGTYKKDDSEHIEDDEVEEFNMLLRHWKGYFGGYVGPAYKDKRIYALGNFIAGIGFKKRHRISLMGCLGSNYNDSIVNLPIDSLYPELQFNSRKQIFGIGVSYAYFALRKNIITLIPTLGIGYWQHRTTSKQEYRNPKIASFTTVKGTLVNETETYYLNPSIDLMLGQKFIRFNASLSTFIGEGIGPISLSLGIIFTAF